MPKLDIESVQDLVRAADIEGFIADGDPADEYDPEHIKQSWAVHFANQTNLLMEMFDPTTEIMKEPSFSLFGLTDAAIHHFSLETLVITEDFRLSGFLRHQGIDVLNFRDVIAISHGS